MCKHIIVIIQTISKFHSVSHIWLYVKRYRIQTDRQRPNGNLGRWYSYSTTRLARSRSPTIGSLHSQALVLRFHFVA